MTDKPQEPEYIKDQPLPDLVEQYRLGDNIRDENGNIIYNSDVIKYLQSIFGDGSDGDVDITGDTNLITDMFYDNLSIASPFVLYTSGYRVFVRNKLTIDAGAKIARNGNDGGNASGSTPGDGGTALSSGSLYGALVGKNGGGGYGGAGGTGDDLAKCLGSNAVDGGAGGEGGFAGGAGGVGGSKTGTVYNYPRGLVSAYMLYDSLPAGDAIKSNPSAGSGGAGGRATNETHGWGAGGGSASGAGIIQIFARNLVNNGTIETIGGKGGNGGNAFSYGGYDDSGAGGGGGGGNGGIIIMVYISKTGTGTTDVSLGVKGAKGLGVTSGHDGYAGVDGVVGKTFELKV